MSFGWNSRGFQTFFRQLKVVAKITGREKGKELRNSLNFRVSFFLIAAGFPLGVLFLTHFSFYFFLSVRGDISLFPWLILVGHMPSEILSRPREICPSSYETPPKIFSTFVTQKCSSA